MLESTEKGGVRNSIRNCLTVFQNDPLLSGAIAKNLLTERTDIIKPIGYNRTGTAITDTDRFIHHIVDNQTGMTAIPLYHTDDLFMQNSIHKRLFHIQTEIGRAHRLNSSHSGESRMPSSA